MEKVGLLNLRWIPHYHHAAITIFVNQQLLCLVQDGYLWLEEPIPNIANLVRRIIHFIVKRNDPINIAEQVVMWVSQNNEG